LGNAHILGALLSPYGVVAIPPVMFGHLLSLFLKFPPPIKQRNLETLLRDGLKPRRFALSWYSCWFV